VKRIDRKQAINKHGKSSRQELKARSDIKPEGGSLSGRRKRGGGAGKIMLPRKKRKQARRLHE